jgi:hypothetical protein
MLDDIHAEYLNIGNELNSTGVTLDTGDSAELSKVQGLCRE